MFGTSLYLCLWEMNNGSWRSLFTDEISSGLDPKWKWLVRKKWLGLLFLMFASWEIWALQLPLVLTFWHHRYLLELGHYEPFFNTKSFFKEKDEKSRTEFNKKLPMLMNIPHIKFFFSNLDSEIFSLFIRSLFPYFLKPELLNFFSRYVNVKSSQRGFSFFPSFFIHDVVIVHNKFVGNWFWCRRKIKIKSFLSTVHKKTSCQLKLIIIFFKKIVEILLQKLNLCSSTI